MKIDRTCLEQFVQKIFHAKGINNEIAQTVAASLVLANLRGHDSHGVIRVIEYVDWLDRGWIQPHGKLEVIRDAGAILMIDGHYQFGQVIGEQATTLAIQKAKEQGVCILTIKRASHLGRIGQFMEQASEAGLVSFSWTNTHGGGVLAAPFGGREPRLSANPLAAGAPLVDQPSVIMDFATCTLAEGKVKVARAKGESLPPGCIVDGQGNPTTDPEAYYGEPHGAILPIAGHKGYALSLFADILAGAIGGGSCSHANVDQIANGWFSMFLDPEAFSGTSFYQQQTAALSQWIKSCKTTKQIKQVMLPGEPERQATVTRSESGIPIDPATWGQLAQIASSLNVQIPQK